MSVAIIAAVFIFNSPATAITIAILGLLEITFSFDNAIVNAKILGRMSPTWQKLFLTVGILIAVFGMRLLFPLIIVSVAAHITPWAALSMALHHPDQYAHHVTAAHGIIAGFGGTFLLMLFLDWLFDDERDVFWLRPIEHFANKVGKLDQAPLATALIFIAAGLSWLNGSMSVAIAAILGMFTYLLVSMLDSYFEDSDVTKVASAGLATFLYLEVLDASFSFDGVVGAFAVSDQIFVIACGLGIGAMFIRSLTVYLTNRGTLGDYQYLEHGAHWAIGTLAVLLLLTIRFDISDLITGCVGLALIGAAFINSIWENKHVR